MKDSNSPIHRDPDKYIQEFIFGDIFEGVGEKAVRTRQARATTRSTNLSALPSLPANLPEFRVIRSARRKRGISAIRQNGLIEIHIPEKMTRRQEREIIPEMIGALLRREAKLKRGNDVLEKMALELLEQHLPDFHERPASVSWRSMRERWGSCTTIDRTIRISDRLNGAPEYVLACVLIHELIHLRIADHSEAFYAQLARFPDLARAEAWLEGFEAGIQLLPDSPVLNSSVD
ncbi:MAG: M48 family metallopeptidase [Actinomycetes bacterium]